MNQPVSIERMSIQMCSGVWRGKTWKDSSPSQEKEKAMKKWHKDSDLEIQFSWDHNQICRMDNRLESIGGRWRWEGVWGGRTKRNLWAAEAPIYRLRGLSARKVTPLPRDSSVYHAPHWPYVPVRVAPVPRWCVMAPTGISGRFSWTHNTPSLPFRTWMGGHWTRIYPNKENK